MNKTSFIVMTLCLICAIVGIINSSIIIDINSSKTRNSIKIGSFNIHLGFNRKFDKIITKFTKKIF